MKNIYRFCFATGIGKSEKGRNEKALREGGREELFFSTTTGNSYSIK